MNSDTTISRYEELRKFRTKFETTAESAALLTLPTVFPQRGTGLSEYDEPIDGFGARGVNNLAAKLTLTLFPPTQSFFKLSVPHDIKAELEAMGAAEVLEEIENLLSSSESRILSSLASMEHTATVFSLMRQLIVTGNGMVWLERDKDSMSATVLSLRHYVLRRGNDGKILELIIMIPNEDSDTGTEGNSVDYTQDAQYTHVLFDRDRQRYDVKQGDGENMAHIASYKESELPFVIPRWNTLPGESYSVGLCGEHIGDLRSLEGCTQAITNVAAVTSRVITLVDPASYTNPEDLRKASSGDYVSGRAEDVTPLVHGNPGDFSITLSLRESLLRNLSYVFLLNSSIQRDAERVTAEEIRFMANELEAALGGVYSLLAGTLVRPMLQWVVAQLKELNVLPKFPEKVGDIEVVIVTGFDVLSRNSDFMKYQTIVALVAQLFGEQALSYFKPRSIIMKLANAQGLDVSDILKTQEELTQEQAMMVQAQAQAQAQGQQQQGEQSG